MIILAVCLLLTISVAYVYYDRQKQFTDAVVGRTGWKDAYTDSDGDSYNSGLSDSRGALVDPPDAIMKKKGVDRLNQKPYDDEVVVEDDHDGDTIPNLKKSGKPGEELDLVEMLREGAQQRTHEGSSTENINLNFYLPDNKEPEHSYDDDDRLSNKQAKKNVSNRKSPNIDDKISHPDAVEGDQEHKSKAKPSRHIKHQAASSCQVFLPAVDERTVKSESFVEHQNEWTNMVASRCKINVVTASDAKEAVDNSNFNTNNLFKDITEHESTLLNSLMTSHNALKTTYGSFLSDVIKMLLLYYQGGWVADPISVIPVKQIPSAWTSAMGPLKSCKVVIGLEFGGIDVNSPHVHKHDNNIQSNGESDLNQQGQITNTIFYSRQPKSTFVRMILDRILEIHNIQGDLVSVGAGNLRRRDADPRLARNQFSKPLEENKNEDVIISVDDSKDQEMSTAADSTTIPPTSHFLTLSTIIIQLLQDLPKQDISTPQEISQLYTNPTGIIQYNVNTGDDTSNGETLCVLGVGWMGRGCLKSAGNARSTDSSCLVERIDNDIVDGNFFPSESEEVNEVKAVQEEPQNGNVDSRKEEIRQQEALDRVPVGNHNIAQADFSKAMKEKNALSDNDKTDSNNEAVNDSADALSKPNSEMLADSNSDNTHQPENKPKPRKNNTGKKTTSNKNKVASPNDLDISKSTNMIDNEDVGDKIDQGKKSNVVIHEGKDTDPLGDAIPNNNPSDGDQSNLDSKEKHDKANNSDSRKVGSLRSSDKKKGGKVASG
ncbi:hypothetical protein HDU76_013123 [Blyttiomyces sp. JEL0837]|nr:hypothetical protein HDU76_013123 [Blyttiomyces sp. JEL0837]